MPKPRRGAALAPEGVEVVPHPLRVRPMGSLLFADDRRSLREEPGALGALALLPDEVLMQILSSGGARELACCACTSRAMRVLALSEDLWKACCLEEEMAPGEWLRYDPGGWRCTYRRRRGLPAAPAASLGATHYYYSDVLYAPWHCGTAAIPPRWSRFENVPRVAASGLSVEEFAARFEAPGQPVILTGLASGWPAAAKWTEAALRDRFGERCGFHVGGHTMSLPAFFDYCASNADEQPLYLFDKRFAETSAGGGGAEPGLAADYAVPAYFSADRDLFAKLPGGCRPDHRWLIAGGTRSGSRCCRSLP
uniref:F-box domain-containing protein n=1 Tax=Emiliania huxleyi TaxID=2903 RepID=A0A7S3WIZ3_EMIHU